MGGGALYLRVDLATGAEPTVVANNLWVNKTVLSLEQAEEPVAMVCSQLPAPA